MSAAKICPQCGTEYPLDVRFCPRDGATLRAPKSDDLVGQVVADRYHIVSKIGEGGMGQVYLAEHVRMKRKSAVKVMSPRLAQDPDAIQRFNREASNACQIAHPNVAAVYDFGETEDGMIYLAMEYIEGEPLTNIIRRQGALPPARAADITRQTADGLGAAHELGIVHRDLKPDNIMVARRRDGSDFVKVVDFGIAKAIEGDDQKVTKTGLAVGTPEYMSPEQLAGDRLDPRTDIYSLGLVSFAMFTGSLPFPAVTSKEAMIMRLTERPRTLAQMRPDVQWPASLQHVFDRSLANDAGARYQDVTEFGRDAVVAAAEMRGGAASDAGTAVMPRIDTPSPSAPRGLPTPGATQPPLRPAVTPDAPTELRPAAHATAATQMMQTPDPQPGRTAAPRGPGEITPSPMPPAGTPPLDLNHAPQLQATGMMPAYRSPTPSHSTAIPSSPAAPGPRPSAPPRTPAAPAPGTSRAPLWTVVGVASLLVLGAGAWYAFRPAVANPPSAAEAGATDSAAPTAVPSTVPAATPPAATPATIPASTPSTTKSAAAPPATAPEPRWADTLRPIQADMQSAAALFEDGDYSGAVQRLRTARAQVERVLTRYPGARLARQTRDRIDRQISQVRTACEAEATAAARRGRTVTCP